MKWYQLSWLCIACMLSITSLSAQGIAKGIVFNALTQRVLSGAHIIVYPSNEGVISDSNGFFEIRLYPGEDTLMVKYPGFNDQKVKVLSDTLQIAMVSEMEIDTVAIVTPETYEETFQIVYNDRSASPTSIYSPTVSSYNPASAPSNAQPSNTEDYSPVEENHERQVLDHPVSTFSIDVDRASYSNIRRFLERNQLPPTDAVRIEEMINYFPYCYPEPTSKEAPFKVYTELSDCPWNPERHLLHIGLQGRKEKLENLPPSNLVFLMDVSGSMGANNKLPLAKKAMKMLVERLRSEDRIAIVVYAGAAGLVLPSTSGADKASILTAIDNMKSGGSTAGGAGIQLAYKVAQEAFMTQGNNRIILATDGDFNIGASSDAELLRLVEEKRKTGVYLSVLGFGMGNYKDNKMETLADNGNGNYAYIDKEEEAKKLLVDEIEGTLHAIAKDVKIQLEFNPAVVGAYRLVGYENRLLAKEDFDDDQKDAGELGSGHTVTALYELELVAAERETISLRYQKPASLSKIAKKNKEIGYLALRYKLPEDESSKLVTTSIDHKIVPYEKSSPDFQLAASVAAFGMQLRQSEYNKDLDYPHISQLAKQAVGKTFDPYLLGLLDLIERANALK